MAHDLLFTDGFDKNVSPTTYYETVKALLGEEWDELTLSVVKTRGPLGEGAEGSSLWFEGAGVLRKNYGGNFARMQGGIYLQKNYPGESTNAAAVRIEFMDGATVQCSIQFNTDGTISLYRGATTTLLATTVESFAHGNVTSIGWDLTFHNSAGAAKILINNVPTSIDLTGLDLCSTANNYANNVQLNAPSGGARGAIDHHYNRCFLAAGGAEEPYPSPYVQTDIPEASVSEEFAPASLVAGTMSIIGSHNSGTNLLYLRKITVPKAGNIQDVLFFAIGAAGKTFLPCIYADSSNSPNGGALLAQGPSLLIPSNNPKDPVALPLSAALAATEGQILWVGFHLTGDPFTGAIANEGNLYRRSLTWGTALPNPGASLAALAEGGPAIGIRITDIVDGNDDILMNTAHGNANYVESGTVGHRDDYVFPEIEADEVYASAIKVRVLSSSGEKIDIQMSNGGMTDTGSVDDITPGVSFAWKSSYFANDPETDAPLTPAVMGNVTGGFEIVP